jgi:hypothetical protein
MTRVNLETNFTNNFEEIFRVEVKRAAFLCQSLGLIFWRKEIDAKAAFKMLVKLTTGRNTPRSADFFGRP